MKIIIIIIIIKFKNNNNNNKASIFGPSNGYRDRDRDSASKRTI